MKQKTLTNDDSITIIGIFLDNFDKDKTDVEFVRQILKEMLFAVDVDKLYAEVNKLKEN